MSNPKVTKPIAAVDSSNTSNTSQTSPTGWPIPGDIKRMLTAIKKLNVLKDIRGQAERLSPYEMHLALDPEPAASAAEAYLAAPSHAIEGVRNALVVLPLMITWLSLGIAGAAYEQSVAIYSQPATTKTSSAAAAAASAANSSTPPPFFQLWQQGFPTLKSVVIGSWHIPLVVNKVRIFTFAEVAFADFFILATMFVLTLLAQGIELHAARKGRDLYKWLEDQLYELSKISIAWALGPGQEQKPRWAMDVQEAMNALTGVMGQVESAVRASVDNFDSTVRSQERVVGQFQGETRIVTNTVAELTSFYQRVREIYEQLNDTIPAITRDVARLADTMEYGQDGNPEELKKMVEQLARLTSALQSIAWNQRRFPWSGFGAPAYAQEPRVQYAPMGNQSERAAGIRNRISRWLHR